MFTVEGHRLGRLPQQRALDLSTAILVHPLQLILFSILTQHSFLFELRNSPFYIPRTFEETTITELLFDYRHFPTPELSSRVFRFCVRVQTTKKITFKNGRFYSCLVFLLIFASSIGPALDAMKSARWRTGRPIVVD